MNKKITAIIIAACVAIFTFFLGGAFLIYNSFIKTQELQAKVKIEQEKTKQEMLKTQNDQQMVQVTTSQETSVPVVAKKRTNYEAELMSRMSSVPENNMVNAGEVFMAWDKELNKVYKLLMSELPESQKTKLRNEERAWLKRKDKEMDRAAEEMAAGRDENGNLIGCGTGCGHAERAMNIEMTKERTIELARMYDDLHR
jgi:hypothetical protein